MDSVVAGFRVGALVGEGAMGVVYRAKGDDGRSVALKVLSPELARDERFRQRFLRESKVASALEHPHVVRTLAYGEDDGVLYLAMEFIEGSDLRQLLKQDGRLDPTRALELLGQVADALDAAADKGLVHRDVKPGNILVTTDSDGEHAYMCDFGLARHVSSVSSLTGERGFVGTIDYVPPEQIEGGAIDRRADVYSLGCVLFECLAGERPYARDSELAVVFAHLNEPPPRLSDVRPDLPDAFDSVFATALAKSPDDRYSSCAELVDAARAALHGKSFVRRKLRRRRALLVGIAVVVAAGATAGALVATRSGPAGVHTGTTAESVALSPSTVSLIDAKTHRVVGRVASSKRAGFANGVWGMAFSRDAAWLVVGPKQSIVRVNLARRKVTSVTRLPWLPGGVTTGAGSVWVAQDFGFQLAQIDPANGRILRRFAIRGAPRDRNSDGIAFGAGSLWVTRERDVVRVDPRTGRITKRLPVENARYLVLADGALWAAGEGGHVWKIDPLEGEITLPPAKLHGFLSDLAVGGGSVWASVLPGNVVFKLNEDDLSLQATPAGGPDPERISFGGGQLWVANTAARTVSLLDQLSGARRRLVAHAGPTIAHYHRGLVWITAQRSPTPLPPVKGEELRLATPTGSGIQTDPRNVGLADEQIVYTTCANLLMYPDAAGRAGTQLRPEVAAAMPTVSADGRIYTFRVRSGFRFSPPSNEPITAETFRHTIERTQAGSGAWAPYLPEIVGTQAFVAGKAQHISGISVEGAKLTIRLVRPTGDFLTRLSMLSFCAVPRSIPTRAKDSPADPVPSAGPYYISSNAGDRTVLLRNPNYGGHRPRHAERIVFTNDVPTPKAVALADAGALDLLPQDFDNTTALFNVGGILDRRSGAGSPAARAGRQQFFNYQAPFLDYIAFNTRRPLFRDVRLRRAVNYALNRPALARAYGDTPGDQIVPPAVPGFPAGRAYPIGPPDLMSARRLAGNKGRHGAIYACGDSRLRRLAQIVRSNLAKIRISLSILHSDDCSDATAKRADLTFGSLGIGPADRDPVAFIAMAIQGAYNYTRPGPGPWHAAAFRHRLDAAGPLRGAERLRAYQKLNDELSRMAPYAVFGDFVWAQYLSPKVDCRVFQGEYGVPDLGLLCKKG